MMEKESDFPVYEKVGAKDAMNTNPFTLASTPKFRESQDLIKICTSSNEQISGGTTILELCLLTCHVMKTKVDEFLKPYYFELLRNFARLCGMRIFMGLKPSISWQRFGVKVDSLEGEQEGAVYSRGSCVKNDAKVE